MQRAWRQFHAESHYHLYLPYSTKSLHSLKFTNEKQFNTKPAALKALLTINYRFWTGVSQENRPGSPKKTANIALKVSTMVGENFEIYLSQVAKIALKLSIIVRENFEIYLFQMAKNVLKIKY